MELEEGQRPTYEHLEYLLEHKGHKAVVCYALRTALRASTLMGQRSLDKIWRENWLWHSYSVIRVYPLIYGCCLKR